MIQYKDKTFDTWDDVIKNYPAMWVMFANIDFKQGEVKSGVIMAILPDEEVIEYRHKHYGEIKLSLRTTETVRITDDDTNAMCYDGATGAGGGYIHGEIINA